MREEGTLGSRVNDNFLIREPLGFRAAPVFLSPHMLPGVEPGGMPAIDHWIDQCVKRVPAPALVAFVWTRQAAILFTKQYLLALMAALDLADDGGTFHRQAPSLVCFPWFGPVFKSPAHR